MRKRLSYILMVFIVFLLMGTVKADYTCKYKWDSGDETLTFTVKGGKVSRSDVDSTTKGGSEDIINWSNEFGGFSAKSYADASACPPVALIFIDKHFFHWEYRYYVCDKRSTQAIKDAYKKDHEQDGYFYMNLQEGPTLDFDLNMEISFKYESAYENNQDQETKEETKTYKEILNAEIPENNFDTPTGYSFIGWHVYFYDKETGKETLYGQKDDEIIYDSSTTLIKPGQNFAKIFNQFNFTGGDKFILRAQWTETDELTPSYINEYGLGQKECETQGYVWNETEYRNYCNVDNLMYVSCGGAFDIPHQAPQLFSFAVNFLKILTPIILIVVSIISLLKALAATNEDEIKKAQKGLIRKVIAAVMVFFIVSIVQFVTMKVADTAEKEDISSCLTCFLNNDCGNTLYYKTNVAGTYMCTNLITGVPDICEEENNKSTEEDKPENATKPEEKPNNSGSDRVNGGGSGGKV